MLQKLAVQNFALIENAQIIWQKGFTVITGETGSGKSILLGALRLILGDRADYAVIRNKDKKTVVEAFFQLSPDNFLQFFDENELDFEKETIIRREIAASGKSRAFVNDTPVQLSVLKALSDQLIHIHSQHHTLALKNKEFQLSILDVLAGNESLLTDFQAHYNNYHHFCKEIESLMEKQHQLAHELEFNQFQLEELEGLKLTTTDYEGISKIVKRGEQFEEIKLLYSNIIQGISGDNGAISQLQQIVRSRLDNDEKIQSLIERINSCIIELNDVNDTAENDVTNLEADPQELAIMTQQLDAFNSALRKHRLSSQEELIQLFDQLSQDVGDVEAFDEKIASLEEKATKEKAAAKKLAAQLSEKRKICAKRTEEEVEILLNSLKLVDAEIQFEFEEQSMKKEGVDAVSFLFSPNKGIAPQPIEKAASGGELSRLMLVIQYLLSQKKQLPSIIFDEIDTGVSGEVAQKIGELLQKMGENMQLIAITHLPQVAGKGTHHFLVKKEIENDQTHTTILPLSEEERIVEIAKLMSGSTVNEAAMLNAKKLMDE